MAITHEITNKKNPNNVLRGELKATTPYSPENYFEFIVDGASGANSFYKKDWVIEEILTLPENLFAVVQFVDEDYDIIRTFWRTGSDEWTESDSDYYSDSEFLNRVKNYAKGKKFEVLFAGVPKAKPVEAEGF